MNRRSIVIIGTALLCLSGCASTAESETQAPVVLPEVQAVTLQPGLQRDITVTGEVVAGKAATITAEYKSDVDSIEVKIGDQVTAGQLLVNLVSPNVDAQYISASTSYETARQNVEQTRITGRKNVESAQVALETAQRNLASVLKQNDARRRQAEERLEAAELDLKLNTEVANTSLESAIRDTDIAINNALSDIDQLLEVSGTRSDINYVYETHIGVKDPSNKTRAKEQYGELLRAYQAPHADYESAMALLKFTEETLLIVRRVLDDSVTSAQYTQASLDGEIKKFNGHLDALRTLVSRLDTARTTLDQTQRQAGIRSQVIIDAETDYTATIADLEASETSAREQVRQAEIALKSAQESAVASEIGANSTLNSVGSQLRDARVAKDEQLIRAPFDGQVVNVSVIEGEEVQAGDAIVTVENRDTVKIVASLSAEEVRSVQPGNRVVIDDTLETTISTVAPSADPVTKKYPIEIFLEAASLLPGEFVNLTCTTVDAEGDERLFAPIAAVHISAAETYVWELHSQDDSYIARKTPVRIGSIVGKYVQLQSGIASGAELIVQGGRALSGDEVEVQLSRSE